MNDYQSDEKNILNNGVGKRDSTSTTALVLAIVGIALAVIGMFSNCCLALFGYIFCVSALIVSIVAVVLKNNIGIVGISLSILGLVLTIFNSIIGAVIATGSYL